MGKCSGQALVESVFFFVTVWVLLVATVAFTKWFLLRQKLLIAVREGAMLYSSGRLHPDEVKQHLLTFLTTDSPALIGDNITIYVGRASGVSAVIFRLDEVRVSYQSSSRLFYYFDPQMEEKCIIKHAPPYALPVGNLFGPPVSW